MSTPSRGPTVISTRSRWAPHIRWGRAATTAITPRASGACSRWATAPCSHPSPEPLRGRTLLAQACSTGQPATHGSDPRMRGLWLRRVVLALVVLALPLEAQAQEPEAAPPPATPAPAEIIPPRLLGEAIVEYPDGASGEAEVVLELLISAAGEVSEASVVSGPEPFGAAARVRALGWRFEPARQGGLARAARIRFLVRFVPPAPEEPPIPALGGEEALAPGAAPAPAPIEVTVLGARSEPRAQTLSRAEVRQLPGAFGDPF